MAKKKIASEMISYINPYWVVSESYTHGKDEIVPGDKIKIKGERGEFKFVQHVYHTQKNVEWIDCFGEGGRHSFYVDKLKGKVKPKRFRKIV